MAPSDPSNRTPRASRPTSDGPSTGTGTGTGAGNAPAKGPNRHARLVSGLSPAHPTAFDVSPTPQDRTAIAAQLGLSEVRKLRFTGEIRAEGKRDWRLDGMLGATVVQPCVVTLAPVVTRIDAPAVRRFLARWDDQREAGSETEMPEDDTLEPLGAHIDPFAVMLEALALEVPDFPRAPDADASDPVAVTEPGKAALTDADLKPFAGLAALKAQLEDESGPDGAGSEDKAETDDPDSD